MAAVLRSLTSRPGKQSAGNDIHVPEGMKAGNMHTYGSYATPATRVLTRTLTRAPSGNRSGFEIAGSVLGIPGLIDPAIVAIKDVRCAAPLDRADTERPS